MGAAGQLPCWRQHPWQGAGNAPNTPCPYGTHHARGCWGAASLPREPREGLRRWVLHPGTPMPHRAPLLLALLHCPLQLLLQRGIVQLQKAGEGQALQCIFMACGPPYTALGITSIQLSTLAVGTRGTPAALPCCWGHSPGHSSVSSPKPMATSREASMVSGEPSNGLPGSPHNRLSWQSLGLPLSPSQHGITPQHPVPLSGVECTHHSQQGRGGPRRRGRGGCRRGPRPAHTPCVPRCGQAWRAPRRSGSPRSPSPCLQGGCAGNRGHHQGAPPNPSTSKSAPLRQPFLHTDVRSMPDMVLGG